MRPRRAMGYYPNLRAEDFVSGIGVTLYRNPANKLFGDMDAWELSAPWSLPQDIPNAFESVTQQEREIASNHNFAWDSDFGYLSPFPEHCGTGLVIEGEFHFEALHLIGDLPAVINAFEALRLNVSSIVEDGIPDAAHIFRIRNAATLGISEKDLIARMQRIFTDAMTQEYNARKALVEETPRILEDSVARSLAVLRSARLLAPIELLDLLSPIRLAVSMGFINGISHTEVIKMMNAQSNAPTLPPAQTAEDDRKRDARDAKLADRTNERFKSVDFSSIAKEYFT